MQYLTPTLLLAVLIVVLFIAYHILELRQDIYALQTYIDENNALLTELRDHVYQLNQGEQTEQDSQTIEEKSPALEFEAQAPKQE